MWLLQEALAELCGLPHVSLQPSAGSHGELAGLLLTRAYHADRGEERTRVLTPDTAHGTNPATVTMAGYEAVKVATDERGRGRRRRPARQGRRAHRLPDADQPQHARPLRREHHRDRLDRARGRRDPLLRRRQPERDHGPLAARATWGSTSSTSTSTRPSPSRTAAAAPGPGRSPSPSGSSPSCRSPQVVRREGEQRARGPRFDLDHDRPKSIGRLRGFQGNFGVFVRSYAYILSLGGDGLAEASETAVSNANYLMSRLARGGRASTSRSPSSAAACTSSSSPAPRPSAS